MIWDNFRNIASLSTGIDSRMLSHLLLAHDFEGIKSRYKLVQSFFEDDDGFSPSVRKQRIRNESTLSELSVTSDFTFYGNEELFASMIRLSAISQKVQLINETNCHGTPLYLLGEKGTPDVTFSENFEQTLSKYDEAQKYMPSLITLEDRTTLQHPFIAHSGFFCAMENNEQLIYHQKGCGLHYQFDRLYDVIATVRLARPKIEASGKVIRPELTVHYYNIPLLIQKVA